MAEHINIAVRCPQCSWRVMDKVSPTTGKIMIKCPRCHRVVEVDLALPKDFLSAGQLGSSIRRNRSE